MKIRQARRLLHASTTAARGPSAERAKSNCGMWQQSWDNQACFRSLSGAKHTHGQTVCESISMPDCGGHAWHTTQPPLPLDRLVRVYNARWGWRVGEPPRRTGACAPGGARACAPALTRPHRRTARTMDGDVQYADYHWTTAVVNPIAIGRPLRMREITLPRLI